MIFVKRQVAALCHVGVAVIPFYLASRTSPLVLIREWRRLRTTIRHFRPDIMHAHFGTMTAFFCSLSARLPLVITYRGSDLNPSASTPRLRAGLGKLLSQLAALRACRIICVSEQLKQRLLWCKRRVTVIPSGVDLSLFYPRPKEAARHELGWRAAERVVLFNAGKFPQVKRLDLAKQAIEAAGALCGNIRFEVLDGSSDSRAIPTLMNAADCLLVTSDWEGSPNIVKEALACNLPVVSVDVGDVRERLAAVRPSRIVGRDPKEIGEALAEVLVRGERSNGFLAVQALSQDKVALAVSSVYQDALRGR
jgi:glycosyltransferase involved in cell wall biosynthesis